MLIEFEFQNFKSFKNKTIFSMESVNIDDLKAHLIDNKYLKISAILGANGSGKSNFVKALIKFILIIRNSIDPEKQKKYPHEPFKLDTNSQNAPTFFRIYFFENNSFFEYLFEIEKDGKILKEELYQKEKSKNKRYLFKRNEKEIKYNIRSFKEAKGLIDKTRENALFLSVVNQFNGKIAKIVYEYITQKILIIDDSDCDDKIEFLAKKLLKQKEIKTKTIKILKKLDFSIKDIEIKKEEFPKVILEKIKNDENISEDIKNKILKEEGIETIKTKHYLFEKDNIKGFMDLDILEESEGTKKLINILPLIIDTINKEKVLIIDELDNSLHTLLIKNLIKWFTQNSKKSQLIFTTHNLNILDKPEILRRDEIWFVSKNPKYEYSELYSLIEFNVRKDKNILKGLLKGEFGAIPIIDNVGN